MERPARRRQRWRAVIWAILGIALPAGAGLGAVAPSDAEQESFLRTARIIARQTLPIGRTRPDRATLSDGRRTHDAHIQTIATSSRRYDPGRRRWVRLRESYAFNVAAYRLDRLLDLRMVPVSVERSIDGRPAAVTWWVDDVLMMESERLARGVEPPDPALWQHHLDQARLYRQLLHDTDPNPSNLLITTGWRLWMVDFTRAFRTYRGLPEADAPGRVDRRLYRGLRGLRPASLRESLDGLITPREIHALLARRDLILDLLDRRIAERGEAAVICDLPGH